MQLWDTRWTVNSQFGTAGDWAIAPAPGSDEAITRIDLGNGSSLALNVGGLDSSDELGTAMILALFSNAEMPDYMIGQNGLTVADKVRWHGNNFGIEGDEEELGSLLFTLRRAPLTEYTAKLAAHYASVALQPLVRQGRCTGFSIVTEILKLPGRINMLIEPLGVTGRRVYSADLYSLR